MFLIGIFGIIILLCMWVGWMWRVAIPWLVLAVIVTTCLGFIIDHWIISIILVVVALMAYGAYDDYKEKHKTPEQLADEQRMKNAEDALKGLDEINK